MYKLSDNPKIDIAAEIKAMSGFLRDRWDNVENLEQLLQSIAEKARTNATHAFTEDAVTMYLYEKTAERRKVIESFSEDAVLLTFYDQPYLLLDSIRGQLYTLADNGKEMLYEEHSSALKAFRKLLTGDLAHLKKAQPKNLRKMTKHYHQDDEAWEKALDDEFEDKHAFKGANTETGAHGGFVFRVSLIYVVQTKDSHNETPISMLLAGAYGHFVDLYKHLNTQTILSDLDRLRPYLLATHPVFEMEFEPQNKLTKALNVLAREEWRGLGEGNPEQEYLECLAERKKQVPPTEEEKKARLVDAVGEIQALFKNALKPKSAKEKEQRRSKRAQEQQAVRDLLKSV